MLADLLGGTRVTSVMGRDLVGGDGIALGAGAFYSDTGLDAQTFGVSVVPKPGVDLAEAEAALDALIARFIEQGPDAAEIDRIRGRIRADEIYALDDLSGRASRIGAALTSGLTLEDVDAWPDLAAVGDGRGRAGGGRGRSSDRELGDGLADAAGRSILRELPQ